MTVQAPIVPLPNETVNDCPFCGAAGRAEQRYCATCGQPGTPLPAGSVLHGRYTIESTLSAGSIGAVYRAQDKRRKREVAIKELLVPAGSGGEDRATLQRAFAREAHRLAQLKHPCLPEIVEHFVEAGRLYLVMALLPGDNLRAMLAARGRGFPEGTARDMGSHLLSLLDYLQERAPGFVLGEIVPSHIVARADGVPCVVGFGLAWRLGLRPRLLAADTPPAPPPNATRRLALLRGKPAENGPVAPTPRDDLYGVGETLYAFLTGYDVQAIPAGLALSPVRDYAPRVSIGMAEAINRAVSPDPATRFPSVATFRASLTTGPLATTSGAIRAPLRGKRLLLPAVVLIILVAAGGVLFYDRRSTAPADLVSDPGVRLPHMAHTAPVADAFTGASLHWPAAGTTVFRRNRELWLSNKSGSRAVISTRGSYVTGADGFTVRATLRLASGPPAAPYGLIAADRSGAHLENVALLVTADGHWTLLRYHAGHAPALVPWQVSSAVRMGHNTPNELQLRLYSGAHGGAGTFSVVINGRRLASGVPAWSTVPAGRVGLLSGSGAVTVADALSVSAPVASSPAVEDHFLSDRLGWSVGGGGAVQLRASLLGVRPRAGRPWQIARPRNIAIDPASGPFTIEATLDTRGPAAGAGRSAGVLFAQPARGASGASFAAVVDLRGRLSVVSLSGGVVHTLVGPLASDRVRSMHGLNTLRVRVSIAHGSLRAQIGDNGGLVTVYTAPSGHLVPTVGIVDIGDTAVDVSALRLSGTGVHLR